MPPRKIDLVLQGKNLDGDTRFTNPLARKQWAQQFDGEHFICTFKLVGSLNDKARMFAYLHGPLLDTCLAYFESSGQYNFVDKVQLYYDFKQMFSAYTRYNSLKKVEEIAYYDYSSNDVSVDLLSKFINDIILYMEQSFEGFTAPDSDSYKTAKKYGSAVKSKKNTGLK